MDITQDTLHKTFKNMLQLIDISDFKTIEVENVNSEILEFGSDEWLKATMRSWYCI